MTDQLKPGASPTRPASRSRRRWLPWAAVGALAIVAVVLLTFLLTSRHSAQEDALADATLTPTAPASPEPTTTTEPNVEPTPTPGGDTPTMPLQPPEDHFPANDISAIPGSDDALEDGDYFGYLEGIDAAAGTVDVDVAIFYSGQAAIDWLTANDPTAENPPPNDYHIVNEVTRVRTIPVTPDVPIWAWCFTKDDPSLGLAQRTFAEWAAATDEYGHTCDAGPTMGRDPAHVYWFDVRDGVVMQIVGQYLP